MNEDIKKDLKQSLMQALLDFEKTQNNPDIVQYHGIYVEVFSELMASLLLSYTILTQDKDKVLSYLDSFVEHIHSNLENTDGLTEDFIENVLKKTLH